MSIETLLEAAKFLELQAQQQQKARGKLLFYYKYSLYFYNYINSKLLHVKYSTYQFLSLNCFQH